MSEVGERVKDVRLKKAMTQEQLARKSKVSADTIVKLETTKRTPRPGTLKKLADALGVDVLVLTGGAELRQPGGPRTIAIGSPVRGPGWSGDKGGNALDPAASEDPEEIRDDLATLRGVPLEWFIFGDYGSLPEDVEEARVRVEVYYAEHGYERDDGYLKDMERLTGEDTASHYIVTNRR